MSLVPVVAAAVRGCLGASARRVTRGPGQPGWGWGTELLVAAQRAALARLATVDPPAARRIMEQAIPRRSPAGAVEAREADCGGVRAVRYAAPGVAADAPHVLYFHGGGYVLGSPATHATLTASLAHACGGTVTSVDYRLAPEHPAPAALEDALAAYAALLAAGVDPARIVVAGDSAGGNLSATLLLALRERALAQPAGGVLLCPWVDLSNAGDSFTRNAETDTLSHGAAEIWAAYYRGERAVTDPTISPAFADLAGLPPLLIQAGGAEVLVDSIEAFAARAKDAGVDVTLDVVPEMFHDFMIVDFIAEAAPAVVRIADFVRRRAAPVSAAAATAAD